MHIQQGYLASRDLGDAQGCILTFKYAADSYYGKLTIEVLPSNEKEWKEGLYSYIENIAISCLSYHLRANLLINFLAQNM